MKFFELIEKMQRGDVKLIVAGTGYSEEMVQKVLSPNPSRKNKIIVRAAKMVIRNRESLIEQISIMANAEN